MPVDGPSAAKKGNPYSSEIIDDGMVHNYNDGDLIAGFDNQSRLGGLEFESG